MSKPSESRSTLLVMWDFQNAGVPTHQVTSVNSTVQGELNKRFKSASHRLFKAFSEMDPEFRTGRQVRVPLLN